jgi:hypothetical protein
MNAFAFLSQRHSLDFVSIVLPHLKHFRGGEFVYAKDVKLFVRSVGQKRGSLKLILNK